MCSSWGLHLHLWLDWVAQARLRHNSPALLLLCLQWVGQSSWLAWGQTLRMLHAKMFYCVSRAMSHPVQPPVLRVYSTSSAALSLPKNWLHGCSRSNPCPDYLRRPLLQHLIPAKVHFNSLALHPLLLLIRRWQTSCRLSKIGCADSASLKLRRPSNRHSSSNKLMRLRSRVRMPVTCMQCSRRNNKLLDKNPCLCAKLVQPSRSSCRCLHAAKLLSHQKLDNCAVEGRWLRPQYPKPQAVDCGKPLRSYLCLPKQVS